MSLKKNFKIKLRKKKKRAPIIYVAFRGGLTLVLYRAVYPGYVRVHQVPDDHSHTELDVQESRIQVRFGNLLPHST